MPFPEATWSGVALTYLLHMALKWTFGALFRLQQQLRREVAVSHCCQDFMETQQGIAGEVNSYLCPLSDIKVPCSQGDIQLNPFPCLSQVSCVQAQFLREMMSRWISKAKICSAANCFLRSRTRGNGDGQSRTHSWNKNSPVNSPSSWPNSAPTQLFFVLSYTYSCSSTMCIEEHALTLASIMVVL